VDDKELKTVIMRLLPRLQPQNDIPAKELETILVETVYQNIRATTLLDSCCISNNIQLSQIKAAIHNLVYRATNDVYYHDRRQFSSQIRGEGHTRTVDEVSHRIAMDIWQKYCFNRTITKPNLDDLCLLCMTDKIAKFSGLLCDYCNEATKLGLDGSLGAYLVRTKIPKQQTHEEACCNLKTLIETIGYIPPAAMLNYNANPGRSIIQELALRQMVLYDDYQLIKLLAVTYTGKWYKATFGSWLKALIVSQVLSDGTRRTSYGTMTVANDGHDCRSLAEKTIDDWLFAHGIEHEIEPVYPNDPELNPSGQMRADWKINHVFVEYFGLMQKKEYLEKARKKEVLCARHNIHLIPLLPDDLFSLDIKLSHLIPK